MCTKSGHRAPVFGRDHVDDDDMINYTMFTMHVCCNKHGESAIQSYEKAPKKRCMWCDEKNEEWRKLNKAKVVQKQYHRQHSMKFKNISGKEGRYHL